jgi:predicted nucleotidyltransferase
MDKKEAVEKVRRYTAIVKNHFPVKMVILFGSYCTGKAREDSDIDVAVVVDKIEDNCLESETQLYKLRRDIDSRIEPVLIGKDERDPSGFFEEILNTGEIIYQI